MTGPDCDILIISPFGDSSHLISFFLSTPPLSLSLSRDQNRKELSAVLDISEHHSFLKCNASLSVSVFIDQCLKKHCQFNRSAVLQLIHSMFERVRLFTMSTNNISHIY